MVHAFNHQRLYHAFAGWPGKNILSRFWLPRPFVADFRYFCANLFLSVQSPKETFVVVKNKLPQFHMETKSVGETKCIWKRVVFWAVKPVFFFRALRLLTLSDILMGNYASVFMPAIRTYLLLLKNESIF